MTYSDNYLMTVAAVMSTLVVALVLTFGQIMRSTLDFHSWLYLSMDRLVARAVKAVPDRWLLRVPLPEIDRVIRRILPNSFMLEARRSIRLQSVLIIVLAVSVLALDTNTIVQVLDGLTGAPIKAADFSSQVTFAVSVNVVLILAAQTFEVIARSRRRTDELMEANKRETTPVGKPATRRARLAVATRPSRRTRRRTHRRGDQ